MIRAGFQVNPTQVPDDVALLARLVDAGKLVLTPAQDYDDSYCIAYARAHAGSVVVTNDRYRDAVQLLVDEGRTREAGELRAWLKRHLLTFTYVGDEFYPNPDFRLSL